MELMFFSAYKACDLIIELPEFKNIDNFDQVLEIIHNMKSKLSHLPNNIAWLYLEKDEFDKIPQHILPKDDDRNFDLMDDWSIYMTMEGLVFFERLRGEDINITIDAMSFKSNDIKKGDIVKSDLDDECYLVVDKLYKVNNINSLSGVNEPYDSRFLGYIPLIFINKVDDPKKNTISNKEGI